jgi:Phage integrase family
MGHKSSLAPASVDPTPHRTARPATARAMIGSEPARHLAPPLVEVGVSVHGDQTVVRDEHRSSQGTGPGLGQTLGLVGQAVARTPWAVQGSAGIWCPIRGDPMTVLSVLDAAGRRRSPATLPGYHARRPRRNKGMRYPADPPTVEEIVAVMRHAPDDRQGRRVRAMIVVLWRAGLRIQEALALAEHDLEPRRESLLVRNGRAAAGARSAWTSGPGRRLQPWLGARAELPVGPLFCIIDGPTRGRPWSGAAVRSEFRRLAVRAGVRRRFAPQGLRHGTRLSSPARACRSTSSSARLGHANFDSSAPRLAPRPSGCAGDRSPPHGSVCASSSRAVSS